MSEKSFLIIGMGRFGRHVARKLNELGMQVMAVDKNERTVQEVLSYVTNAQVGDGADKYFLSTLGVDNFDVCIVAIGEDFLSSLEATFYLKELGARKVIARAAQDTQRKFLLRNGADDVVYPEKAMGEWTAVRYASDSFFDYMDLDENYGVFEIAVPSEWAGHTIGEIGVRNKYHMNIIAVKTGDKTDIMTGANYMLSTSQTLMVLGRIDEMTKFF